MKRKQTVDQQHPTGHTMSGTNTHCCMCASHRALHCALDMCTPCQQLTLRQLAGSWPHTLFPR